MGYNMHWGPNPTTLGLASLSTVEVPYLSQDVVLALGAGMVWSLDGPTNARLSKQGKARQALEGVGGSAAGRQTRGGVQAGREVVS